MVYSGYYAQMLLRRAYRATCNSWRMLTYEGCAASSGRLVVQRLTISQFSRLCHPNWSRVCPVLSVHAPFPLLLPRSQVYAELSKVSSHMSYTYLHASIPVTDQIFRIIDVAIQTSWTHVGSTNSLTPPTLQQSILSYYYPTPSRTRTIPRPARMIKADSIQPYLDAYSVRHRPPQPQRFVAPPRRSISRIRLSLAESSESLQCLHTTSRGTSPPSESPFASAPLSRSS